MLLRLFLPLCIGAFASSQAAGQSISHMLISPWGLSAQSASYQLDASMGELAVRTFTQGGQTLNQGFHQYYENTPPTSTEPEVLLPGSLLLYPNPTSGVLHLELFTEATPLQIFSIDGRLVWSDFKPLGTSQWTLHLQELPAGWYLLRVLPPGQLPQTLRFIKH